MAESSNSQLLHQLFKALPENHRVTFLKEVIDSLSETQREKLIAELAPAVKVPVLPDRLTNYQKQDLGRSQPGPALSEDEKKTRMEAQFKQFSIQEAGGGKARMQRQLWSCLGIGVLVITTLCLLAVGVRFVFDYSRSALTTETDQVASGEFPDAGQMTGDYTNTQKNDGVYQEIIEEEKNGRPSSRYSYLEHIWQFHVTGGKEVVLHIKAYKSPENTEQGFVFAWSADNQKFRNLLTINNTIDNKEYQSAELPIMEDGPVFIRVRDTNRSRGNRVKDTLYVDHLFIRSK